MIPRFSLQRPHSLDEAIAACAAAEGEAAYIAGGTELLQVMKMGLAQFATLIDLKGLLELRAIALEPDGRLRIGAATTHRDVERSQAVQEMLPALARLEGHLANVRVRNQGTIGGNLAFAEPHSDPATLLLACDARVELAGISGTRELSVDEFIQGPLFTARDPEEVLVSIRVPGARPGLGRGYEKAKFFERPAVAVGVELRVADGTVAAARVSVGSLTEVPMLVEAAAAALVGAAATDSAVAAAAAAGAGTFGELDVVDDLNGSADYKRHLAGRLFERAAREAIGEASRNA